MPDKTLEEIARDTHTLIVTLKELIEREYPNREEIERRFTPKEASNRKLALGLALMLVTVTLSYFLTVATISQCFLGGVNHPSACGALPGYEEADARSKAVLKQFQELVQRSEKNERRIDRLEGK